MSQLTIGVVQMDCTLKDKESNLSKAERYFDQVGAEVDLVCYPELFTTGYHLELISKDFYELAETIPGPTTERLAQKALEWETAVVANIVERDELQEGVLYDTTFVLNGKGEYIGKYRKVHLYPTEHQFFRSGSTFPVFDVLGIRLGTATCYDHAFGEIFRILALQGAQLIVIPSAVPKNYEYLLHLRTRARAQDNQLFTVAVNRVGTEQNITYCGHSMVVNPRGEVLAQAGDGEEVLVTAIDLSQILTERQQEPVLRSRRPELYKKWGL
ncbi:putative amidohydrolase [Caldalkalibacillus uzonensis]|uniref:Amidohydrolase n=1 Tax=Caldalkalibacillus uzonensis TaxID=353224 RepID=A0ABU0CQK0_9BACI|nr:carbon-nitrogen hydrolase family protein [Caldalkalibacillus uzonensis]MDQ0338675.1 putative amidohydrolase [Caldalkalibacillus uzonensis]